VKGIDSRKTTDLRLDIEADAPDDSPERIERLIAYLTERIRRACPDSKVAVRYVGARRRRMKGGIPLATFGE
jgi:hypothetical protein